MTQDMMTRQERKIFERPLVCSSCQEPAAAECSCEGDYQQAARRRELLPTAPTTGRWVLLREEEEAQVVWYAQDGAERVPFAQRWVYHSWGFEWGYEGSGPADLALNLLGEFVHPTEAWELHQHFKRGAIARISQHKGGVITAEGIRAWLTEWWALEDRVAAELEAQVLNGEPRDQEPRGILHG